MLNDIGEERSGGGGDEREINAVDDAPTGAGTGEIESTADPLHGADSEPGGGER